jgi:hypothetical protein
VVSKWDAVNCQLDQFGDRATLVAEVKRSCALMPNHERDHFRAAQRTQAVRLTSAL